MLFRDKLHKELNSRSEDFQLFLREQGSELEFYLAALGKLEKTPFAEIEKRLSEIENVGAIPADELGKQGSFCFQFLPVAKNPVAPPRRPNAATPPLKGGEFSLGSDKHNSWRNHEQARVWAADILADRTTFAADGSQLYVEKETSLPIGAIQIGWFENPHNSTETYEKNADFRILSPKDLLVDQEEPLNPETRVGEERFHAEVAKVAEFLTAKSGWQRRGERMPLAFFDGTMLVSFSLPQTKIQTSFVQAMVELVLHSREMQVPMIGYVDRSFARDLVSLLENFSAETFEKKTLYDAAILHRAIPGFEKVLRSWGDRTCFCHSKRRGLNAFLDPATGKSLVGFSYLQTTSDSAPARLDIPAWIYEHGLLDELIDVVRAECVVGLGYPYALEAADQTAVISNRDREVFFRALQEFASREKLDFSVTRKGASKGRRR